MAGEHPAEQLGRGEPLATGLRADVPQQGGSGLDDEDQRDQLPPRRHHRQQRHRADAHEQAGPHHRGVAEPTDEPAGHHRGQQPAHGHAAEQQAVAGAVQPEQARAVEHERGHADLPGERRDGHAQRDGPQQLAVDQVDQALPDVPQRVEPPGPGGRRGHGEDAGERQRDQVGQHRHPRGQADPPRQQHPGERRHHEPHQPLVDHHQPGVGGVQPVSPDHVGQQRAGGPLADHLAAAHHERHDHQRRQRQLLAAGQHGQHGRGQQLRDQRAHQHRQPAHPVQQHADEQRQQHPRQVTGHGHQGHAHRVGGHRQRDQRQHRHHQPVGSGRGHGNALQPEPAGVPGTPATPSRGTAVDHLTSHTPQLGRMRRAAASALSAHRPGAGLLSDPTAPPARPTCSCRTDSRWPSPQHSGRHRLSARSRTRGTRTGRREHR